MAAARRTWLMNSVETEKLIYGFLNDLPVVYAHGGRKSIRRTGVWQQPGVGLWAAAGAGADRMGEAGRARPTMEASFRGAVEQRCLGVAGVLSDPVELILASFADHFVPLQRRKKVNASIDALDQSDDSWPASRRSPRRFLPPAQGPSAASRMNSASRKILCSAAAIFTSFPLGIREPDRPRRARVGLFFVWSRAGFGIGSLVFAHGFVSPGRGFRSGMYRISSGNGSGSVLIGVDSPYIGAAYTAVAAATGTYAGRISVRNKTTAISIS